MHFQISPKIIIGEFSKHLLFEKEYSNILVLTSKSIESIHKISKQVKSISGSKIKVISDVVPELPFTYVKMLYDRMDIYPDLIIAIGGGSVIDLAKAISVSSNYDNLVKNFNNSKVNLKKKCALMVVPSTFGTGSETSFGSILYNDLENIKGGIRGEELLPEKIILDYKIYKSANSKLMSEAGFDCLTHAIETYLSTKSNDFTRLNSINAINNIFSNLEKAVNKREQNNLIKMAVTSTLMGVNLAYSSTCMPHRIQYIIGPMTNTSHAQGLIALYNGWLKHIKNINDLSFKNLLSDLNLNSNQFINKIKQLKVNLNINYTLSDFGIKKSDVISIAKMVKGSLENDPAFKNKSSIINVLNEAL